MELKESYEYGFIIHEGGRTYLNMICSGCKNMEKVWITETEGIVKRECEFCGKENMINLNYKKVEE